MKKSIRIAISCENITHATLFFGGQGVDVIGGRVLGYRGGWRLGVFVRLQGIGVGGVG